MKLALVLLLTFASAASARSLFSWWGMEGNPWDSSSNLCQQSQPTCAPKTLSMEDRLALIARDNDQDYSGKATYYDVAIDLSNNYDKDKDGVVTEQECVKRFSCAYGLTDQVAEFVCLRLLGGEPCVTISTFNTPPFSTGGVPMKDFLQTNRERFEKFCDDRCVNDELSVADKVQLYAMSNDRNRDGNVTSLDREYDLSTVYDTDKDGQVSKMEWVARWTCNYGDSGDFARYMWDRITQGAKSIPTTFFSGTEFDAGFSIRDFADRVHQQYHNYWHGDAPAAAQCRLT